uniref:Very-long-chain (3R)-3-hydroxyacyl-CoA dehydratase n=1 Tax=Daucus carota subsp. sativus TaxID=79200 RepID=A0A165A7J0_DAUCS
MLLLANLFVRIVPSGVLMPLMQWGGRTHVVIAVARGIKEEFTAIFIMFTAWCSIEVIRYSNYALNCFNMSPYILTYLRYTVFIVLFPIGFLSEMWLMYEALPFIKKKNMYGKSFAALPFSYSDFVTVLLCVYPFLWLKLYLHMFKQRRSKLGKRHKKKRN